MGKIIYYISFLLFLLFPMTTLAQQEAVVSAEIETVLQLVDYDLKNEKYQQVSVRIDSLKKTKNYRKNTFDKLAVDLRKAKLLYELDKSEKSIYLLLDGVQKLNNYQNSRTYWLYIKRLGIYFRANKDYDKADTYLTVSLENSLLRKDTTDIITSYFEKGKNFNSLYNIYKSTNINHIKDRDSALYYFKKVISYPLNDKNQNYITKAYNNLAVHEIVNENFYISQKYLEKSLLIKQKYHDTISITITLSNLAGISYKKKNYKRAIIEYKQAYELIKNNSLKSSLQSKRNLSQNISWTYSQLKQFEKAYEYQEIATEFQDSLTLINQTRNISIIEANFFEAQKITSEKNKRLHAQVLFYGMTLLTFVLIIIGYLIYKRLKNKQQRTERKMTRLKFKALNAQMNPHFINNLLLCIHDLMDNNEKKAAIESLDKFNTLTNLVLRATKSNLISLHDEITMLNLYLELQTIRFDQKFEYSINTSALDINDMERIKIPPLILQPLVENSIVHGFNSLKVKGKVVLDFSFIDDEYLVCTITDNGKTNLISLETKTYNGSGISLKNINERLQLVDGTKNNKELVSFISIKDKNNTIIGSKTELIIPLIYN